MLLKGQPNQVVQKMVKRPGHRRRIVPLFRFDENGNAEIDEKKYTDTDVSKLKHLFGRKELTDDEVRELAREKGIKSYHLKKIETLRKELGV